MDLDRFKQSESARQTKTAKERSDRKLDRDGGQRGKETEKGRGRRYQKRWGVWEDVH